MSGALSLFFFIGILPPFTFFLRGLAIFMHFSHVCIHVFSLICLLLSMNQTEPFEKGGTVLVQSIAFRHSLVFGIKFVFISFVFPFCEFHISCSDGNVSSNSVGVCALSRHNVVGPLLQSPQSFYLCL